MDTTAQVEKFLRDIRRRNRGDIVPSVLLLPIFGLFAATSPPGSLTFFGYLLFILGILFSISVIWFVGSPRGDLGGHPASDIDYWASEMLRQAKLLRLFPLWVLGPLLPGFGLLLWTRDIADLQDVLWISMEIAFVGLVLAVITWLGLRRASKLALGASSLKEAQSI